jgi:hypothetical protein
LRSPDDLAAALLVPGVRLAADSQRLYESCHTPYRRPSEHRRLPLRRCPTQIFQQDRSVIESLERSASAVTPLCELLIDVRSVLIGQ